MLVALPACAGFYFLDWNLFNDTFQFVEGGRSVTVVEVDEEESGQGGAN
jgi:hypothetical protein